MKYRYFKRVVTFCVTVVIGTSCSLDVEIYDQLSSDNFLTTESDAASAVTGIYHTIRSGGWAGYNCAWGSLLTMQVGNTDEADCNWLWEPQMDYIWQPYNTDLAQFYFEMVPAITKTTSLIAKLKASLLDEDVANAFIAELRTIRAVMAYDLYDLYGTCPIVVDEELALDPTALNQWKDPRPTVEWYVDFVEDELLDAIEELPMADDQSSDEYGRMNQGIAQMYLLKLYMHEAGQERHYRNNEVKAMEWWAKAEVITDDIISSGQYDLEKNYIDIWAPDNERNDEIIFPVPCAPIAGLGNVFLAHTLPTDYKSQNGVAITCWGGYLSTWDVYDSFAAGDKRRETLVAEYWNGAKMVDRRNDDIVGKSQPFPMKYQENSETTGQWDGSDYVINRYAEVILGRAEALNEIYGPTAEVKTLIHSIRRRAFDNYENSAHESLVDDINDKNLMREHILNERKWEFNWEGMRRPDLIRHGQLISNAQDRGKTDASEEHILYCIPQSVIYENPAIEQNPGYNK